MNIAIYRAIIEILLTMIISFTKYIQNIDLETFKSMQTLMNKLVMKILVWIYII